MPTKGLGLAAVLAEPGARGAGPCGWSFSVVTIFALPLLRGPLPFLFPSRPCPTRAPKVSGSVSRLPRTSRPWEPALCGGHTRPRQLWDLDGGKGELELGSPRPPRPVPPSGPPLRLAALPAGSRVPKATTAPANGGGASPPRGGGFSPCARVGSGPPSHPILTLSSPPRSSPSLPVPPPLPPPDGLHTPRAGRCRPRGGQRLGLAARATAEGDPPCPEMPPDSRCARGQPS